MPAAGVDAVRIIETLNRHKVAYVVVGGFAMELWDVAVQPTVDIDITPEMSKSNLRRLANAINELDAGIRYGADVVRIPGGFTSENIADMRVLNLATVAGPLDLTILPAGTDGYTELVTKATGIEYRGVLVPTASLLDVARSKEAAGRAKDLKVLPAILAHLERSERES
jgi:hypothetical protein